MTVTSKMIIDTADCPFCGSVKGTKCVKNGKSKSRSHHQRQKAAQAVFTIARKSKKAAARLKHQMKSQSNKTPKKDFYASWEWKKLRFAALEMHESRCMCCGFQPSAEHNGKIVVDHIRPRSKFPELGLDINNLQILCNDCNMGKSNTSTTDFRERWYGDVADEELNDEQLMDLAFSNTIN